MPSIDVLLQETVHLLACRPIRGPRTVGDVPQPAHILLDTTALCAIQTRQQFARLLSHTLDGVLGRVSVAAAIRDARRAQARADGEELEASMVNKRQERRISRLISERGPEYAISVSVDGLGVRKRDARSDACCQDLLYAVPASMRDECPRRWVREYRLLGCPRREERNATGFERLPAFGWDDRSRRGMCQNERRPSHH
jgi:hypothetical protein